MSLDPFADPFYEPFLTKGEYKEPFDTEIGEAFRKMPLMTKGQLEILVRKVTGYKKDRALSYMKHLTSTGQVLVSDKGYVTTKAALDVISEKSSPYKLYLYGNVRLKNFSPKDRFERAAECFSVVLDMWNDVKGLTISDGLFPLSFIHKRGHFLCEIIRIPNNQESSYKALLLEDCRDILKEKEGTGTDTIRKNAAVLMEKTFRVAVVETKASAPYVPYLGFRFIVINSNEDPSGFEVAQTRTKEEAWKDFESMIL